MSARIDAPVMCTAAELDALETLEMLMRDLLAKSEANRIQSGPRLAIEVELTKLDAMRAVQRAKETS
jgi:hypothetical protein